MNRISWFIIILVFLLLPLQLFAYQIKSGNRTGINKEEIVDGNLYITGSNIEIDGTVKGDLLCAGQTIHITGTVEGNIFCAGQNLFFSGKTGGDFISATQNLDLEGKIGNNLIAAGQNISFKKKSTVGWEAFIAAADSDIAGTISKGLALAGSRINLDGEVGKDVDIWVSDSDQGSLTVSSGTAISGNLNYRSTKELSKSDDAKIKGKINFQKQSVNRSISKGFSWLTAWLYGTISTIVIGLFFIFFTPLFTHKTITSLQTEHRRNIITGLVILLITPLLGIFLIITLVGLPLAILLLLLWVCILWLGKVFAVIYLGGLILNRINKEKSGNLGIALLLGSITGYLLFSIPYIGGLFSLFAMIYGAGAIYRSFQS